MTIRAYYDPSVIDPDFDTWVWGEAPIDPTFCEEPYRGPIRHISGPSSVNGLIPRTPVDPQESWEEWKRSYLAMLEREAGR